jgi:hypothetical protein
MGYQGLSRFHIIDKGTGLLLKVFFYMSYGSGKRKEVGGLTNHSLSP